MSETYDNPANWEKAHQPLESVRAPDEAIQAGQREIGKHVISYQLHCETVKKLETELARLRKECEWQAKTVSLYEELRKATDGGSESMTHSDAVEAIEYLKEVNEQHAEQLRTARDNLAVESDSEAETLLRELRRTLSNIPIWSDDTEPAIAKIDGYFNRKEKKDGR